MKKNKYTLFQNFIYWIRATKEGCPKIFAFGIPLIMLNCIVPLITTFLPKVVIEMIMNKEVLKTVILWTGGMTLALAVCSALQKYLEQLIYWHKFKMNTYFLRKVTGK